ncbi:MAG: class I SAM-dependent methyltransferase [candidate division Zixibacteria bacterium]|nr:class I SAM-dependent methyltransferase [candidate division Zixibacteria bacterium]
MFKELEKINQRPKLFGHYTADQLWNDPYVSRQMLKYHLDENTELASKPKDFIDRSVNWIISRFNIGENSRICDLGCGPGLYTSRLAQTGADVTGIDFSESSINYAIETAKADSLPITYHCRNYLDFKPSRTYDLITMIYYDFCVLNPEQRNKLLKVVHSCLKDDGSFLLDFLTLDFYDKTAEKRTVDFSPGDGFWSAEPYYEFVNTFKYEKEKIILNKHTIIEKTRTREIYNWLQCYGQDSVIALFSENGFRFTDHFLNVANDEFEDDSHEIALVAEKLNCDVSR